MAATEPRASETTWARAALTLALPSARARMAAETRLASEAEDGHDQHDAALDRLAASASAATASTTMKTAVTPRAMPFRKAARVSARLNP